MKLLDAERMVLFTMLSDRSACDQALREIRSEEFSGSRSRVLFEAIASSIADNDNGGPPNWMDVADRIRAASDFPIGEVFSDVLGDDPPSFSSVFFDDAINRVHEGHARRQAQMGVASVGELLTSGVSIHEVLQEYEASVGSFLRQAKDIRRLLSNEAITMKELAMSKIPPIPSFVGDGLLTDRCFVMFNGDPGLGKSWIAIQLAICIVTGQPFLGIPTTKRRVGIIELELPRPMFQQRLLVCRDFYEREVKRDILDELDEITVAFREDLDDPVDLYQNPFAVMDLIKSKGLEFLIVDPISRANGGMDENDNQAVGQISENIEKIRHSTGCSVMLVHHEAKGENRSVYSGRGGSRFGTDPTTIFRIQEDPKRGTRFLSFPKTNFGPTPEPIYLAKDGQSPYYRIDKPATSADLSGRLREEIEEFLRDRAPMWPTLDQIMEKTNFVVGRRTYQRHLKSLGAKACGKGPEATWRLSAPEAPPEEQPDLPV